MIRIQAEKINPMEIIDSVRNNSAGAVVSFFGTVRSEDETSSDIVALFYEAYNEMALKKIGEIIEEARNKYSIIDVSVVQRTGRVNLKEDSIGIAVSSVHRKDAFLACNYIIDKIKIIPPIWKKEIYSSGEVWKSETL
ncbi:MAG: molybdenum cofactor biosynthesis protein MoaE [Ferroplasma sp.]|uniref:molybdenum cofactor biosynthesis protein MoaE n=1 Tax=Ferroplasma sp. TaxID=2591003 RepID=UPI0028151C0C|nr:molybdenum cofactor biosynthesis protein MoaE [Ferroplasma sp.]WMT50398.1 MAG: molybdenum cofactor biosynthesis protein MoaE [Ferroplasma sp.]